MENFFRRNLKSVNGVLAVVFGSVAIFLPNITLKALGIYFAFTVLVGGIALLTSAFRSRKNNPKWYLFLPEGIIGLVLGILILSWPESIATIFVAIIGVWAITIGLIFIFSFYRNRNEGFTNTMMVLVGILSVVMGGIIIFNPFESTRIVIVLIGIYTLIYGIYSIINSSKNYS